jgi:hypothetical protein
LNNSASFLLFLTAIAFAQGASPVAPVQSLQPKTTLPIIFTDGLDANHEHIGDVVHAKTTQRIALPRGESLPASAQLAGHVIAASRFVFDKTSYAQQRVSVLAIHFDSVEWKASRLPLDVSVRALADPITSWDARTPGPSDEDPQATVTQIGGDLLTPSQKDVISHDDEVVGYNLRGGIYAHLIASSGNSPDGCDASDTEESMGLFSASACGLNGFTDTNLQQTGRAREASTLILVSHRRAPKIWKNSTALLEVLPKGITIAAR